MEVEVGVEVELLVLPFRLSFLVYLLIPIYITCLNMPASYILDSHFLSLWSLFLSFQLRNCARVNRIEC